MSEQDIQAAADAWLAPENQTHRGADARGPNGELSPRDMKIIANMTADALARRDRTQAAVSRSNPAPAGKRRLTVDLPEAVSDRLREAAEAAGVNRTTMLIRAIGIAAELEEHARAGGKITLENAQGERERLRLL